MHGAHIKNDIFAIAHLCVLLSLHKHAPVEFQVSHGIK